MVIKLAVEIGFLNKKIPTQYLGKPVFLIMLAETSDGHKVHFCRIRYCGQCGDAFLQCLQDQQCTEAGESYTNDVFGTVDKPNAVHQLLCYVR